MFEACVCDHQSRRVKFSLIVLVVSVDEDSERFRYLLLFAHVHSYRTRNV